MGLDSRVKDIGFAHFATQHPASPALIDPTNRRWSRAELFATANQIAHALRAQGMAERDVVAILSPNCFEFVATYLAATDIGLYVVPINWHLAPAEAAYILENSGATTLFAHQRLAPLVGKLLEYGCTERVKTRISFGTIAGFTHLDTLTAEQPRHRVSGPVTGRMLVYTSATTGRPKAIDVPIAGAELALRRTIAFFNACGVHCEDGNVHLCASMLYHAAPLDCAAVALHMGHTVVLVERWEPEQLLQLIELHRVTTSFMVPAMFVRLLKLPPHVREQYDTSSLRLAVHSAAPCPPRVKEQILQWWGPIVWEGYGAAEGSGTAVSPLEWLQHPGTVGRPIPGTELLILDDHGRELPAGQIGTIYFSRYTGDRFEYKGDPEKTKAAYHGELFTVGDLGWVNDDGYLFICDRRVDLIICGGMNIYPAEIEQWLVQHPSVADCAVFGIPDPLMGESVHAVVQPTLEASADAALTASITSFLRQQLSPVKIPRRIDYLPALPRDPNGKLYKRLLRERYGTGSASQG